MTLCSNCSRKVPNNYSFCPDCGHNLGGIKTKMASVKARMEYNLKSKINEIKQNLNYRITDYLEKVEQEQELLLGEVRIPDKRRETIGNALKNFQNRLQTEPTTSEEFEKWLENLDQRLDDEKCIVCFQKWVNNTSSIVVCKYCRSGGHREHLETWIKTNKFCPLCRQKLAAHELITVRIN